MLRIFLGIALRHQETVIAAAPTRIFPTDGGPRCIDGAASLYDVEETAGLAEMRISLAPHRIGLIAVHFGEFFPCLFKAEAEMISQALDVALFERDHWIRAAIARTF